MRIQAARHSFSRAIQVQNTYELFKVKIVNKHHSSVTYELVELYADPIKDIFYRADLTPVEDTGLYAIEFTIKHKKKSKIQYLIRYVHFSFASKHWVDKDVMKKLC